MFESKRSSSPHARVVIYNIAKYLWCNNQDQYSCASEYNKRWVKERFMKGLITKRRVCDEDRDKVVELYNSR